MSAVQENVAAMRFALAEATRERDAAVARLEEAQEYRQNERREEQHDFRNMLAVVRAVARRSADGADTVEEYAAVLDGRLSAYLHVQAAIARDAGRCVDLLTLIADELLRFVPMLIHMGIPIIGMSGNPKSLLAKYSNVHINVAVEREACPLNLAPTSSTTAVLSMGDALAVALMVVRNFKPKDFAQFHPGGELGKRLLTTAADVMRTEDMPIIPQEMHLGEAIIHVSKGKLGMGVALHEDGSIAGLITDGDIRRAMEKWQAQFFDKTVSDIMTRSPKIVSTQTKISEIQHIMNKYKIHSVLVADNDRHLLGIVDHYRCMV